MATLSFPSPTQLKNISDPSIASDAATKNYVDSQISGGGAVAAAAGSNTYIQFNSANVLGASANLTFNSATNLLTVVGNLAANNATFTTGTGGTISGANIVSANYFYGTLRTAAQPNITSVGTLTSLTVSGDTTLSGNLTVTGTTITVNSNNVSYVDSLIELHTQANLAPLTSDDGKDIGIHVHYFKTTDKHAFFGFSNDSLAFEYYVDGTETNGVFSGTYGNIKGLTFISTATTGTAPFTVNSTTQVANLNSATAGTVITAAQPNITSTGTLVNLSVSGNTAFSGANISLGSISNLHITGGSSGYVLKTDGAGNLSWGADSASLSSAVDEFTGDGTTVAFTLSATPSNKNFTFAVVQGIMQPKSSYTVSGAVLTFSSAPPNGALVEVTTLGIG
jgi:hypothetical protein